MNYNNFLIKQNFLQWLDFIANTDKNPDIRQSASEIAYQMRGNSIIPPEPLYNSLYLKYKLKVVSTIINNTNQVLLFSYNGTSQTLIGVIETETYSNNQSCCNIPIPSVSAYVSPSVTPTPSITGTPLVTPSNTKTPNVTPSVTKTNTSTPTPSKTPRPPCVTKTPSLTPSVTKTVTPSSSLTATPTPSITLTSTPSQTISSTATPSETPSATASPGTPTPTPSNSSTPSITPSNTRTPSHTPSQTPTNTITPSPTHTQTPTNTQTPTSTQTPTHTRTPTATPSETPPEVILWAVKNAVSNSSPEVVLEYLNFTKGKGQVYIEKNPKESANITSTIYGYNTLGPCSRINKNPNGYSGMTTWTGVPKNPSITTYAGPVYFFFSKPVTDLHIAIYSLGGYNDNIYVYLETSVPFELVCNTVSQYQGLKLDSTYPTTRFYAREGYGILKFPGTHSMISFTRYKGAAELYSNFVWGAPDQ